MLDLKHAFYGAAAPDCQACCYIWHFRRLTIRHPTSAQPCTNDNPSASNFDHHSLCLCTCRLCQILHSLSFCVTVVDGVWHALRCPQQAWLGSFVTGCVTSDTCSSRRRRGDRGTASRSPALSTKLIISMAPPGFHGVALTKHQHLDIKTSLFLSAFLFLTHFRTLVVATHIISVPITLQYL